MQNKKSVAKGFLIGALTAILLMAIVGAVDRQTQNVTRNTTISFNSVCTSSDGRTVYATDNFNVYRSTDGGDNWTVVLKKNGSSGF